MGSGFPEVFLLLPSLLQDRVDEASLAIDFVYMPKSISEKRDGEGRGATFTLDLKLAQASMAA